MIGKVLITGSSGYFGRLLTNYLLSRNIPVIGIDIKESKESLPGPFRFYPCSIVEKEKLRAIFLKEKPTHIIHFACSFNKIRQRRQEYLVDVTGSGNILELSDSTPSVRQLIFSSSAAAYGGNKDNGEWLLEADPLRPGKYRYGMNKKEIEAMFHETPTSPRLRVVSLRICTVLGPDYDKPGSIASMLIQFPFLPACCKYNRLQFMHSDDFLSLFSFILEDPNIRGIFNVASDSYVEVNDLLPGKKYVHISLLVVKGILWILWNLKLLNLQPAAGKDIVYPIIIHPGKIISRYRFKAKYSSREAFSDFKQRNNIPQVAFF